MQDFEGMEGRILVGLWTTTEPSCPSSRHQGCKRSHSIPAVHIKGLGPGLHTRQGVATEGRSQGRRPSVLESQHPGNSRGLGPWLVTSVAGMLLSAWAHAHAMIMFFTANALCLHYRC